MGANRGGRCLVDACRGPQVFGLGRDVEDVLDDVVALA
jgi:hypothetical protein